MNELLELKLELEAVRRAYWQSQQQLSQLLIERSLAIEKSLRAELQREHSPASSQVPNASAKAPDSSITKVPLDCGARHPPTSP
jgi:hypothetical protein